MCMTFGYNPQINFCHFFHSLNLVIFGLKCETITQKLNLNLQQPDTKQSLQMAIQHRKLYEATPNFSVIIFTCNDIGDLFK